MGLIAGQYTPHSTTTWFNWLTNEKSVDAIHSGDFLHAFETWPRFNLDDDHQLILRPCNVVAVGVSGREGVWGEHRAVASTAQRRVFAVLDDFGGVRLG